ncbi:DUF3800 domain-containing protein [Sphingomonas cavernae]|uniref:DUF3800 domain-containing protein n=1 Tax=Sphingomonas cavernae TaxID=2320861 RepID=A0A418WSZ3_9SPHN|nr:DUF3800 domain-containing protein [Sphingomonas cavernae]RJF94296.1 hypothetical protein D3876_06595 [Sphingomonas cavernae]
MPIYCDESGGTSAGAMVFAGVAIEAEAADRLLARFKQVTAARGEMKGSRISLVERGLFFELLERFGGRAIVAQLPAKQVPGVPGEKDRDLKAYAALLEEVVEAWLPETAGCADVIIDDGRYDAATLALVRQDIAALLGTCGRARLEDSRRSAGVQIADVIANSVFNLAVVSERAERIRRILAPFMANGVVRLKTLG